MAAKDHDVILTYRRRKDEAQEVVRKVATEGRKAVALRLDAANISGFLNFIEQVRGVFRDVWSREHVDWLVNNAGIRVSGSFAETSEAVFDEMMNLYQKGVYFLTQATSLTAGEILGHVAQQSDRLWMALAIPSLP